MDKINNVNPIKIKTLTGAQTPKISYGLLEYFQFKFKEKLTKILRLTVSNDG